MAPPDLTTQAGRDAYRSEVRAVGGPLRLIGLLIVVAGAVLAILSRFSSLPMPAWIDTAILFTLGVGWAVLIYVIIKRNQYHRRRMAGEDGTQNAR